MLYFLAFTFSLFSPSLPFTPFSSLHRPLQHSPTHDVLPTAYNAQQIKHITFTQSTYCHTASISDGNTKLTARLAALLHCWRGNSVWHDYQPQAVTSITWHAWLGKHFNHAETHKPGHTHTHQNEKQQRNEEDNHSKKTLLEKEWEESKSFWLDKTTIT